MIESHDSFSAWLASRPESVRALAAKYPAGARYMVDGVAHYLLGYTEDHELILSPLDPTTDYSASLHVSVVVCASQFEQQQ